MSGFGGEMWCRWLAVLKVVVKATVREHVDEGGCFFRRERRNWNRGRQSASNRPRA
jgi:hypothetical protein